MKISNFIKKLQNQPEHIKKIILWSVVLIIGLTLIVWWIRNFSQKIKEFEKEEFIKGLDLPVPEEKLPEFPKMEMLELLGEELKKIEEEPKETRDEQKE